MEEKKYTAVTVFLIFGLLLLGFVGAVAISNPDKISTESLFEIILLFQIILGSVCTTLSITLTKKGYQLYIGLLLFGCGLFTYLVAKILPYTIMQWWPVYGVLASLFVLIDGLFIYRRLKLGYAFPSFLIMGASLIFLLFSFKIVKASFTTVFFIAGPILLISFAVFFTLIFIAQKKTKKLILDDDPDAFDEEQILIKDDDDLD